MLKQDGESTKKRAGFVALVISEQMAVSVFPRRCSFPAAFATESCTEENQDVNSLKTNNN
jgi:hypothetical protein